jgi:hypothetical protein
VAQLYLQALGTQFSRLLRHAWVTVRLLFNPGHHTGNKLYIHCIIHIEAVAAHGFQPQLHTVLQEVMEVANFVKDFAVLCE